MIFCSSTWICFRLWTSDTLFLSEFVLARGSCLLLQLYWSNPTGPGTAAPSSRRASDLIRCTDTLSAEASRGRAASMARLCHAQWKSARDRPTCLLYMMQHFHGLEAKFVWYPNQPIILVRISGLGHLSRNKDFYPVAARTSKNSETCSFCSNHDIAGSWWRSPRCMTN